MCFDSVIEEQRPFASAKHDFTLGVSENLWEYLRDLMNDKSSQINLKKIACSQCYWVACLRIWEPLGAPERKIVLGYRLLDNEVIRTGPPERIQPTPPPASGSAWYSGSWFSHTSTLLKSSSRASTHELSNVATNIFRDSKVMLGWWFIGFAHSEGFTCALYEALRRNSNMNIFSVH